MRRHEAYAAVMEPMRRLRRFVMSAAAISLTASSAAMFTIDTGAAWAVPPGTTGATTVPLRQVLRNCDYSTISSVGGKGHGVATAVIRLAGSSAVADVHLVTAEPDTHYDVGLIQAPRPSSATCGPGDPGTAYGSLNTDGAGTGAVTVQEGLGPGTTGVWVVIQRADEHSQNPAEFYSSDFIAPV